MTTAQILGLINADDPLDVLAAHLTNEVWTRGSFAAAVEANTLDAYLSQGEHQASRFEEEIYDVYADVYREFEKAEHPLKSRLESEVFSQPEFTLVIFDALSLRELPAVLAVMADAGFACHVSHALACVPSETTVFAKQHFGASGPAGIKPTLDSGGFAYEYAKNTDWKPDFRHDQRRRVIWTLYPDNVFNLNSAAVSYRDHIVQPVQTILRSILEGDPVTPLFITSDHGYLWQGGEAFWALGAAEAKIMADAFKQGRSTTQSTEGLAIRTDKVCVLEPAAAARGRFAWQKTVKGSASLFQHGGVSLMECLTPWVVAGSANG